ncbi:MAG: GtrA family protein [Ruminococcus sp.]|nr:GtrA family protein [Ruminococcus sp.]
MEKLILWFVKLFPKPIQNFYFKYEKGLLYCFYGGLTTLVSMITKLVPMHFLGESAWAVTLCTAFSWCCAVTFAFFTNKKYVFKSKTRTKKAFWTEFTSFYGARLASLGIEWVLSVGLISYAGWNKYLVTILAQVIILAVNYLFSKLFVFKKRETEE